ncbi:hypothetical protein [Mesorhizobium sp. M0129]|uniref:hypothetical protein n=1 Tax=Mesorhizobium sp. M0129 TaxID=2956886 RepID=UPI00333C6A3B
MKATQDFTERLVPRFPTAQASQADTPCAEPAAPADSPPAGAGFCHFTESSRVGARGQGEAAPAVDASSAGAVTLSIKLSPAVALILKLATDAAGIDHHEAKSRAICVYADRIGFPSLARTAADEISDDLHDVPQFARRDQVRFSRTREALGKKGVLK